MNISRALKSNFKKTIRQSTNKYLTPELKQELGFVPAVQAKDVSDDFNSFWSPVQSNLLNPSNKSEKISAWVIGTVVTLGIILLIAIFSLVAPNHKNYSTSEGNIVVVDGKSKTSEEPKATEEKSVDAMTSDEINIRNIVVSSEDLSAVASKSPILTAGSASVMEYKVLNGDTLEKICVKFYGQYNSKLIEKIKFANKISNSRYLKVGQKLIIPYN